MGICTDTRQVMNTYSEAKNAAMIKEFGEQQYSYQNIYVTGLVKQGGVLVDSIDKAIEFIKSVEGEF